MFAPVAPPVLAVQDEVRAAFGWSLGDDRNSAIALSQKMAVGAPFGVATWNEKTRMARLRDLASQCLEASCVVVVGAAATVDEVNAAAGPDTVFVAADGAAGAVRDGLPLVAVVSDLDGGDHLQSAAKRGAVVVLHAHGDNRAAWEHHLSTWATWTKPPSLVLTHQVPEDLEGIHNPGGFTDGDRAVCLLRWMGVAEERMAFVGFALHRVGPWSGITNPHRKLEKLTWMAEVLDRLGLRQRALPQDEDS